MFAINHVHFKKEKKYTWMTNFISIMYDKFFKLIFLQVCVNQERLQAFIRGARYLRIKGLEDNADDSDIEVCTA